MLPNLPLFRTHQCPSHYTTHMASFNLASCSSLSIEPTESLLPRGWWQWQGGCWQQHSWASVPWWCVAAKAGRGMRPRKRLHVWHKPYPRKALTFHFCLFLYSYCLLGDEFKLCQNYRPSEVKLQIMKCFCQQQNGWVYSYWKYPGEKGKIREVLRNQLGLNIHTAVTLMFGIIWQVRLMCFRPLSIKAW